MSITTLVDKKRVFVAMSGGVDSSVAATLLKQKGYKVIGAHMRCWNLDGCAEQDAEDARRAAEVLGIPFYVFDFEKAYKDKVVKYMIDGYRKGITPNPDVMCNKEIKFGLFLKKALEMGADYVATGHYVRIVGYDRNDRGVRKNKRSDRSTRSSIAELSLAAAKDKNKDQSYFLWTLTQDQLKHCLFPIGDYTKPQVRALARKFNLLNADKKDSQGICFLGQVSLPDFLSRYIRPKVGAIIDHSGEVIGQHRGAHLYTIGQRHIGIANRGLTQTKRGTMRTGDKKPLYVADKDVKKNVLVVAEGNDNPALYRKEIELANVNFLNALPLAIRVLPVCARVRYRQPLAKASLECQGSGFKLVFDKPQKFVAAGQSAVFYDRKGVMLGGGVIAGQ